MPLDYIGIHISPVLSHLPTAEHLCARKLDRIDRTEAIIHLDIIGLILKLLASTERKFKEFSA